MPSNSWQALLSRPNITDYVAVNTFTVLQNITPSATTLPDITIPANYLTVGTAWRTTTIGRYSTTVTPTLQLAHCLNGAGTTLAICAATTTASGAANLTFMIQTVSVVRAVGTSGTVMCGGFVSGLTALAVAMAPASAPATAAINTTASNTLTAAAAWSASSASNTLTVHSHVVEILN